MEAPGADLGDKRGSVVIDAKALLKAHEERLRIARRFRSAQCKFQPATHRLNTLTTRSAIVALLRRFSAVGNGTTKGLKPKAIAKIAKSAIVRGLVMLMPLDLALGKAVLLDVFKGGLDVGLGDGLAAVFARLVRCKGSETVDARESGGFEDLVDAGEGGAVEFEALGHVLKKGGAQGLTVVEREVALGHGGASFRGPTGAS